ncbi:hypothetical protein LAZ67_7003360 [Cordylochernes scorpioides]|uniref:Sulfotransferase domain-containing protein n=1 Tax=Cordylochernes scorpioides TaxID=51811 RepID=A0ABY6KPC0_9ARAC|nr:hypothetical protein LAZ67_7003360 [Cordylochernes scorpioides]
MVPQTGITLIRHSRKFTAALIIGIIALERNLVSEKILHLPIVLIIYYVRDPRGVFNSRQKKEIAIWCRRIPTCYDPEMFCEQVKADIESYCKLKEKYPDRITILRYEDISVNPLENSRKIYSWIGIEKLPNEVEDFIKTHTNASLDKESRPRGQEKLALAYTTKRNSKETAFAWQKQLPIGLLEELQAHCKDVYQNLNYPEEWTFSNHDAIFGNEFEPSCRL